MKKYKLHYYYLATGMEGIAQEFPEEIIQADSREEAIWIYHTKNGISHGTFQNYMSKEKYVREWATTCTEVM